MLIEGQEFIERQDELSCLEFMRKYGARGLNGGMLNKSALHFYSALNMRIVNLFVEIRSCLLNQTVECILSRFRKEVPFAAIQHSTSI